MYAFASLGFGFRRSNISKNDKKYSRHTPKPRVGGIPQDYNTFNHVEHKGLDKKCIQKHNYLCVKPLQSASITVQCSSNQKVNMCRAYLARLITTKYNA